MCLQVVDEGKKRAIQVEKEGFPDAVVWNPWIKKAAGMADFGDEEYKVSICMNGITQKYSLKSVCDSMRAVLLEVSIDCLHSPRTQVRPAYLLKRLQ